MARKTVVVSDLSGNVVKDAVKVTFVWGNGSRIVLDADESEIADLAAKGKAQGRRGRKPKA